jgi:hypothetical protein
MSMHRATVPPAEGAALHVRIAQGLLWITGPAFVLLAMVGAARFHSRVPFLDMWPGYIQFYLRVLDGDVAAWLAMHHEHRIVLSRLLFWVDLAWLQGSMWFLVAANFLIAGGTWWTWRAVLRAHPQVPDAARTPLLLFMAACVFSWAQRDNLFWAFQSQFLLAQWLPLLALFLLYRAGDPQAGRGHFWLAFAVGVLCLGSMANGVLALPLMAGYAAFRGLGWRRAALLGATGAVAAIAYFHDFRSVPAHGPVGEAALHQPALLAAHVLAFLGSPAYALAGYRWLPLAQACGLALLLLVAAKLWQLRKPAAERPFEAFLLAYAVYVLATAAGIALGRLSLGVEQALTGRYTTPAIMAWLAVLLLYGRNVGTAWLAGRWRLVAPLGLALAAMWSLQLTALASQRTGLFAWQVAALALEMGVRDEQQIRFVYPHPDEALSIAREAARRDVALFGQGPLHDAGRRLGQAAAPLAPFGCDGHIEEALQVAGDERFLRVSGTAAARDAGRGALLLVDPGGRVAGVALLGAEAGSHRRHFRGYLLAGTATGDLVFATSDARACSSSAVASPPLR